MCSDHAALSIAFSARSFREVKGGTSVSRCPSWFGLSYARGAWKVILSGPARRMCPTHRKRRCRIFRIRLKLVENGLASCGIESPVNLASILLFAPFKVLIVSRLRFQVSHPNVRIEHTDAS